MFRLSKWLRRSYRPAIEANIRRTRWSDLSTAPAADRAGRSDRPIAAVGVAGFQGTRDVHGDETRPIRAGGPRRGPVSDTRADNPRTLWPGGQPVGKVAAPTADWSRSRARSGLRIMVVSLRVPDSPRLGPGRTSKELAP